MRVRYTCTLNDCGDPYMAHNPKGGWVSAADYDTLAAEVDQRDATITALLEMLNMNTKPRPKHEDFHPFDHEQWNDAVCEWDRNAALHARALEIAGRAE